MSVLSGYGKYKRYVLTDTGYKLCSQWTSSNTVHFDDGNTAQTKLGAISGITDSLTSTSSNVALSSKAGKNLQDQVTAVNTQLDGKVSKDGDTINGDLVIYGNNGVNGLKIGRFSTDTESAKFTVDDAGLRVENKQDEASCKILFRLIATDTESGNTGENAAQNDIVFFGNKSGSLLTVDRIRFKNSEFAEVYVSDDGTAFSYKNASGKASLISVKRIVDAIDEKQAKITGAASTIVSSNLTSNRALATDANGKVIASNTTGTELHYLIGVTSKVQDQLDSLNTALSGKQDAITGGATTITSSNLSKNRALIANGSGKVAVSAVTSTELGYISGVTSNVQTQLNSLSDGLSGKQNIITGAASTIATNNLTASRALATDANGKVIVSSVTATELSYLSAAKSNIQNQINALSAKLPTDIEQRDIESRGVIYSIRYRRGLVEFKTTGGALTSALEAYKSYTFVISINITTNAYLYPVIPVTKIICIWEGVFAKLNINESGLVEIVPFADLGVGYTPLIHEMYMASL